MLQSMRLQRIGHDLATDQQQIKKNEREEIKNIPCFPHKGNIKIIDDAAVVKMGK